MAQTITIRGKVLNVEFAKSVSKERFCEIYSSLRPEVIEEGWSELLKETKRKSKVTPAKSVEKKAESKKD